jgi:hypothetical protein
MTKKLGYGDLDDSSLAEVISDCSLSDETQGSQSDCINVYQKVTPSEWGYPDSS